MRNRGKGRDLRNELLFPIIHDSARPRRPFRIPSGLRSGAAQLRISPCYEGTGTGLRRRPHLAPQAASWNPPHRLGSPVPGAAVVRPDASAGSRCPWLAGDSTPLRSRSCARSLPFRSPGAFLIHLRDAGEECHRPFAPQAASWNPPHRLGSTGLGAAAAGGGAQTCGFLARRATKRRPPPRRRSETRDCSAPTFSLGGTLPGFSAIITGVSPHFREEVRHDPEDPAHRGGGQKPFRRHPLLP